MTGAEHDERERAELAARLLDAVDPPTGAARDLMFRHTFDAPAAVTGAHLLPPEAFLLAFREAVDDEPADAPWDAGLLEPDDGPPPFDDGLVDDGPPWHHPPDFPVEDPHAPPTGSEDDGDPGW